jgi:hypothetical protein
MGVMLWAIRLGWGAGVYAVLVNGSRSCAGRGDDHSMSGVRASATQFAFHNANRPCSFRNILSSIWLPVRHSRDYYRL